jgi:hypothetical protein
VDVVCGSKDAIVKERPRVAPLLPEEVMQQQPSMLREEAHTMRMDITGAG